MIGLFLSCPGDGMVDIQDLKSWDRKVVPVQVRPWVLMNWVLMNWGRKKEDALREGINVESKRPMSLKP